MTRILTIALISLISHAALAQDSDKDESTQPQVAESQPDESLASSQNLGPIDSITPQHRSVDEVREALITFFPGNVFVVDGTGGRIFFRDRDRLRRRVDEFLKDFDTPRQEITRTSHSNEDSRINVTQLREGDVTSSDLKGLVDASLPRPANNTKVGLYVVNLNMEVHSAKAIVDRLTSQFPEDRFTAVESQGRIYFQCDKVLADPVIHFLIENDLIQDEEGKPSTARQLNVSVSEFSPHLSVFVAPQVKTVEALHSYLSNKFLGAEFVLDSEGRAIVYRGRRDMVEALQNAVDEFEKNPHLFATSYKYPESPSAPQTRAHSLTRNARQQNTVEASQSYIADKSNDDSAAWSAHVRIMELVDKHSIDELREFAKQSRRSIDSLVSRLALHQDEDELRIRLRTAIKNEFCIQQAARVAEIADQRRKLTEIEKRLLHQIEQAAESIDDLYRSIVKPFESDTIIGGQP